MTQKSTTNNQVNIDGNITNANVIAGDENVIQNIVITFDFLGSLLNFSQEFNQAAAKIANESGTSEKKLAKHLENETFLNNLQAILTSVLKKYQRVEMMDILEELSGMLKPIVEKHKKYKHEYSYPYGQFCGEFMQAVISSPNIRKAFSTKPLKTIAFNHNLGDHGRTGIKLEVLSKLLPFSKICEGYYFSADINGFESPDSIKKISFSILTPNSGTKKPRKIKKDIYHSAWAVAGTFSRAVNFQDRNITIETIEGGYQKFSTLELDLQKFSAFVIGLSSDFILISSTVLEHDRQFNEHMKDLFGKLNLDW